MVMTTPGNDMVEPPPFSGPDWDMLPTRTPNAAPMWRLTVTLGFTVAPEPLLMTTTSTVHCSPLSMGGLVKSRALQAPEGVTLWMARSEKSTGVTNKSVVTDCGGLVLGMVKVSVKTEGVPVTAPFTARAVTSKVPPADDGSMETL